MAAQWVVAAITSTHSLSVAVCADGGLSGQASHLKMLNLGSSRPLAAPSIWVLLPHSPLPFSAGGLHPSVQPLSAANPYHLSGEQSPGSPVPPA